MFYVITCSDRSLRRVATTVHQAADILREMNLSHCIVSGYDDQSGEVVTKLVEKFDEFYLSARATKPELLDILFESHGEILVQTIQLAIAFGGIEMFLHSKGPGSVVAVQLEDGEG